MWLAASVISDCIYPSMDVPFGTMHRKNLWLFSQAPFWSERFGSQKKMCVRFPVVMDSSIPCPRIRVRCHLPVLDAAGKIIRYIGDASKKETFKTAISDFVIDKLIIEPVLREDGEAAKRAYMYYKEMLDRHGDGDGGPLQ